MLDFTADQVRMHRHAADKSQALAQMAEAMTADGLTDAAYLLGMQTRETQGATYLGQGVAIPHGTPDSRASVRTTGVRILQFPDGVDWGDGQIVYLAVGIAAQSDEHLGILQMLTRALSNESLEGALRAAPDADAIVALLKGGPAALMLDESLIALGVPATDLEELVWAGARLLKHAACASAGFASALMTKTPLPMGDGLWWLDSDIDVSRPGLAFVTPQDRVAIDGDAVRGLFCLASMGESHTAVVVRLCDLLAAGQGDQLLDQTDPRNVARTLGAEQAPDWPQARVRLPNPLGLHARPANQLARIAKAFEGDVRVRLAGGHAAVSAKSLSRLLSLGARRGQTLVFSAEPAVAQTALPALVAAVEQGLGEAFDPLPPIVDADEAADDAAFGGTFGGTFNGSHATDKGAAPAAKPMLAAPPPPASGVEHRGVPASPGIASGPAYLAVVPTFVYPPQGESPAHENARLDAALGTVRTDLATWLDHCTSNDIRGIFTAHLEMLDDPDLRERAGARMKKGASAEAAWADVIQEAATEQEALKDALLAERAADLRDIGRRVLARLCGIETPPEPDTPYVLIMTEVGPSDVARLDATRVAGILTARGGSTSHSAIVARSLGIAAIVGAGDGVLALAPDVPVLIDGERGTFTISPDTDALERAVAQRAQRQMRQTRADAHSQEAARTIDGHQVEICVNLGNTASGAAAVAAGAEGVGLLRTEFLFMAQDREPTHDEQVASYGRLFDDFDGRPVVVRTLDVGGDKPLSYWPMPHEDNPFLGVRGIRLSLTRPEVLQAQLRALLQAARGRPLRIMFPMVGDLFEWRAARAMVDRAIAEAGPQSAVDLQVGIMIEVPAAVLIAEHFAQEVDFFSIGTNDLTQYTLAIDRGHPQLSAQADGLHPAVLRLIDATVRAAHAQGKWVGVCGELAGDTQAVPILVGLGVDELSMSTSAIARVKADIRELRRDDAIALAQHALAAPSAQAVRALVAGDA
ncbi:phosphoenolpyruvate--protein phosphotransferase [Schauerella aestuarii]|uniref:phosphoenolpyruvate--protein phosphotransferase n=1 Tax=Schauerella aestuarii TaxID=2511204 RepID=UPI00136E6492|nr:phosphoenolpyruvate--protein phosphotransferase [Achromobacter aestuarii]MYZ43836.1 phosphoenolpyruvate--protein phosphotransferase [Achromobacter aestuarii]